MEKLKQKLADMPIRQALLRITLVGTLIASVLIIAFLILWNTLLYNWGTQLNHATWRMFGISAQALGRIVVISGSILGSLLILIGVMHKSADLFYQLKLARSLKQLNTGIEQIRHQNLDFKLHNANHDELGALTESFEQMRRALQKALKHSWQLLEDQKEVNAAFSHDLRTPLTVLQGDTEMLTNATPNPDMLSLVQDMQTQLVRITDFVGLMSKITSLQAAPIEKSECSQAELE